MNQVPLGDSETRVPIVGGPKDGDTLIIDKVFVTDGRVCRSQGLLYTMVVNEHGGSQLKYQYKTGEVW